MISLKSQGLPPTPLECEEFLSYDFAEDSLALRRWDDDAMASGAYLYYKRCSRVNASNA